ncbi:zonular occludens toxin domain-containing protein [Pyruvatibacter mobilis]|uniref:zonular occludens toxin domain-containing protein n=1 Tax=Pyruvatibacter mobilis TaxID=1712261 RepID=UPI003BAA2B03
MTSGGIQLVVGSRGSGKSTKARELAKPYKMAIAIDPARDWQRTRGWKRANDLKQVIALIRRHWKAGARISYTPPVGYEAEALNHVARIVTQAQAGFAEGRLKRKFLIAVDEAAECYGNRHQEATAMAEFKRVINQGRHDGIDVIAITQRPADVATRLRTNADIWWAFRLGDQTAIKAVAEKIGRKEAAQLATMPPFTYLQISNGNVQKGRTRKPR